MKKMFTVIVVLSVLGVCAALAQTQATIGIAAGVPVGDTYVQPVGLASVDVPSVAPQSAAPSAGYSPSGTMDVSNIVADLMLAYQQGGSTNLNPLDIARAFALKTPDHFNCWLTGNMLISNSFQWVAMSFIMTLDFGITNLVVYDAYGNVTQIPTPEPIYGIPLGDGGLWQNVGVYVSAVTKTGDSSGYAWTNVNSIVKGDNLMVTLIPAMIRQTLPVDISQCFGDFQVIINNMPYGYGFGPENGQIVLELAPVGGQYPYVVRRISDGTVIATGWVQPFRPATEDNDTYLGVGYLGNVKELAFSQPNGVEDWIGANSLAMNCVIPNDSGSVTGQVIFIDAGSRGLDIQMWGKFSISIYSATGNDGDMQLLPTQDLSADPYSTRIATTGMNAGKVVIVVVPKQGNTVQNPWISVHGWYGLPGDNGRG